MKKIVLLLLIIAIVITGLAVGPAFVDYDGYFLIALESGTYQLSIFGFVVALVTLFLVLWLSILIIKKIIDVLAGSQDWLFGFSRRRKQKAFTQGLISLAEGNVEKAQKSLNKIVGEDFDGLNLLALAEAETQLGNKDRAREIWISAAQIPETALAAHLSICKDFILENKCEQALTYINELDDKIQDEIAIIKLWARCLDETSKYSVLKQKLPKWKKVLGKDYDYWSLIASKGEFAEVASKDGANQLKRMWQSLPRSTRKEPGQIAAYAQQLIDQGMHEDAQIVLVESQKSSPNPLLYGLYRQLKNLQTNKAIKQLESWLKHDDKNVDMLSTLGQLAYNMDDNLLAEKALSKAIKLSNEKRDVLLLAQIKEAQKDNIHALELYKKSAL